MSKFVLEMNVSLDGYVDDLGSNLVMGPPSQKHFQYWIETIQGYTGSLYGRRMYEVMRYWDEDRPEWDESLRTFAIAWRNLPKWVVSRTLSDVGPNTTLIVGDIEAHVRDLKARNDGTISVSGPQLAGLMTQLGLIDEYWLYLHPFVLGAGQPFFAGPRPPLRLTAQERIGPDVIRLIYVPA